MATMTTTPSSSGSVAMSSTQVHFIGARKESQGIFLLVPPIKEFHDVHKMLLSLAMVHSKLIEKDLATLLKHLVRIRQPIVFNVKRRECEGNLDSLIVRRT
jgi:hypothetical protein